MDVFRYLQQPTTIFNMKSVAILSLLASVAVASPVAIAEPVAITLDARQSSSTTRTELEDGSSSACPKAIFICARGSNEAGNMGTLVCPFTANKLETDLGAANVWVQGVGGAYDAGLAANLLPAGTSAGAITEGKRLFNLAASKCPKTPVVAAGYSQGAALMASAVSGLSSTVMTQIKGVALFGYTKNQQNGGKIPNFSSAKTAVYCNEGDLVCDGTLIVQAPHLQYSDTAATTAPAFLEAQLKKA
ncbi:cutinase precursor [Pyrenophora seminiperda CCB06]|uniref:Cutinase n=1 Tax=Pyrenophora seminiperda CCB06 TaxID=1302712 RepID=A0A3M7MGI4_9PLEO|nr:cutinase precursor [Pyrenophora seminiperda CCB06]